MKKVAGLIIILAALILGAYFVMGIFTEKAIKKNVEVINQNNGLRAELGPYNKGLFSSTTQIKWRIHIPARIVNNVEGKPEVAAAEDYQIEMPLHIYHGPMIIADKKVLFGMGYAKSVLQIPDKLAEKLDNIFTKESIKPFLDINIFVNYLNKSFIDLNISSFNLISKDGKMKIDWLGMKNKFAISSTNQFEGDLNLDGFTVIKEDATLSITGASTSYDLQKNANGLLVGNIKCSLSNFLALDKKQKQFKINDVKLSSNSDIQKDLFSTHLNVSVNAVSLNEKTYGPGNLELALRNIDTDVLVKLNESAKAMQQSPDAEQKKILFSMLPELPKLFGKGAEFEVTDFNVKLPQGMIKGSLLISMPKGDSINPFDLLQKIQGNAKLKLPKEILASFMRQSIKQPLAKQADPQQTMTQQSKLPNINQAPVADEQFVNSQTDKQLTSLEQAGLIVAQGTDYSIEISLEQGKFSVNGKPYDPSIPLKF